MLVSVRGLKEADENLARLGAVAGKKVLRSVMFRAMKPVLQAVQASLVGLPGSGALHKAVRRTTNKQTNPNVFLYSIAPKTGDKTAAALASMFYHRKVSGIFWGHLVEWGFTHSPDGTPVAGKQIFTRAMNAHGSQVINIFAEHIGTACVKALTKQSQSDATE